MCYDWQYPFRLIWLRSNSLTARIDRKVVFVCCIEIPIVGSTYTCSSIHFSNPDFLYSVRISDEQAAKILTVGQAIDFVLDSTQSAAADREPGP